jgi:hypothetical protein
MAWRNTRYLVLKCHAVSECTHRWNFIVAHKESAGFAPPIVTKLTNGQQRRAQISCNDSHPNTMVIVESTDRKSIYVPQQSMAVTAPVFIKSQLPGCILWRSSAPNFTQSGQEMWKVRVALLLRIQSTRCWTDFRETRAWSTSFCKEIPYRISWKSGKSFKLWY